jgi:hypothetical protein
MERERVAAAPSGVAEAVPLRFRFVGVALEREAEREDSAGLSCPVRTLGGRPLWPSLRRKGALVGARSTGGSVVLAETVTRLRGAGSSSPP